MNTYKSAVEAKNGGPFAASNRPVCPGVAFQWIDKFEFLKRLLSHIPPYIVVYYQRCFEHSILPLLYYTRTWSDIKKQMNMEKLQFKTTINAPTAKVYETMIGETTFKQWTAVFNPSSDFESDAVGGGWEKGSKILFVGTGENGKREGMVGYIRENTPNEYVSIEYVGVVDGDIEITEGPVAEEWRGFENYTFTADGEMTTVTVDTDVNDQMVDYFRETYPKALKSLKELCEG
ncbi:hypothetical protein ACFOET_19580 [Parapedobacter deserti]|uniref:SRPBCC domain-containing protein n=1 Tax=Parapedobacter deserti TaxID=1912957 RepID=A0ABV7JST5_9SPHI